VPYALAGSIEVGLGSTIQVYDEVRAAVEEDQAGRLHRDEVTLGDDA
jgi:hypothetical protein